jgi:hypothetical protein
MTKTHKTHKTHSKESIYTIPEEEDWGDNTKESIYTIPEEEDWGDNTKEWKELISGDSNVEYTIQKTKSLIHDPNNNLSEYEITSIMLYVINSKNLHSVIIGNILMQTNKLDTLQAYIYALACGNIKIATWLELLVQDVFISDLNKKRCLEKITKRNKSFYIKLKILDDTVRSSIERNKKYIRLIDKQKKTIQDLRTKNKAWWKCW